MKSRNTNTPPSTTMSKKVTYRGATTTQDELKAEQNAQRQQQGERVISYRGARARFDVTNPQPWFRDFVKYRGAEGEVQIGL